MKPDIPVRKMQLRNGSQGVDHYIFVGQHHPFGATGGAAGIVDLGDVRFRNDHFGNGRRRPRHNFFIAQIPAPIRKLARLIAGPDDFFYGRKIRTDLVDRLPEPGIGNQRLGAGIVHDHGEFPGGEPVVQRNGRRSSQRNGVINLQKTVTVGMQDGDPVAFFDPRPFQVIREAAQASEKFLIFPSAVATDDRLFAGEELASLLQRVGQKHLVTSPYGMENPVSRRRTNISTIYPWIPPSWFAYVMHFSQ